VVLRVGQASRRRQLREALRQVYDLERLTSRVALQVATPRELARLGRSLRQLPVLAGLLERCTGASLDRELPEALRWPDGGDLLADVAELIERALCDDPPALSGEGGIIRSGYNAELDELVGLADGGRSEILAIEARERERTGIGSLKVRFNRVFGYYIEVTRTHLKSVPADYQRKQTLANAERFITPELAEHEARVLGAEERRLALEQQLFEELRRQVAAQVARLTEAAQFVARLDVLAALAEVAQAHDYVRPEVDEGECIIIEDGRHPVVERFLPAGQFVPNDIHLDPAEARLLVLTGPNMAGKSTVMRQTALIVIMAQLGSFVPARRARIGVVDRIFTRVGASDNLARGESTFMVEMRETAAILRHASVRSLVVIDEIGRGTATYDGISIAWAVAEHLHDRVRAKCLFATHYHELCALADGRPRVRNLNVAVQEWKGRIVFLRKLAAGGSSRSYGIEVARLAGLDRSVVERARRVLAALEAGETLDGVPLRGRPADQRSTSQLALFRPPAGPSPAEAAVLEELRQLRPEELTPLQALNRLAALVERLGARDTRGQS
jgi:DNA mismatch repair protein MutS